MTVKMSDIAKAAGASVSTVGRVLHGNGYVSQDARERIEKAIKELGYIPNQNAKTLKCRRSGIIGSLVLQNPNGLYYRINDSILAAAEKGGYKLVTMEVPMAGQAEERLVQSFVGLGVDGLVITSDALVPAACFELLQKAEIPVVAVERGYLEQGVDSLITEDFQGVYDAVQRIIRKGHKRIGFVAPGFPHEVERRRIEGYKQAMEQSGLKVEPALTQIVEKYGAEHGRAAAELLMELKDPPTAIFCTADTLAAGVLQALYEKRLRVPEDVSLVGYDDVLSSSLSPAIDSVGLVLDDIGEKVVSLLKSRMKNAGLPARKETIYTRYVERGTVRKIN